jgi:hypothetical protein
MNDPSLSTKGLCTNTIKTMAASYDAYSLSFAVVLS